MFKWLNNRIVVLTAILVFGIWLPADMASAGGYYYGHHGYGHQYGGHGYGHRYAYYGLGSYALYGHHGYGNYYYTPYYGYYSSPYTYGYSSYSNERYTYKNQEDVRISHSRDGWQLLKDNHPNKALSAFAIEAQDHPAKGMPKVGYALASAGTGQLGRGVWAMRRALRFDPESLHYVAVDQSLRKRIRDLIHRYDYDSTSAKATDAAFMRASLHYLLRETPAARTAMKQALDTRNGTVSTRNLKKLIHDSP